MSFLLYLLIRATGTQLPGVDPHEWAEEFGRAVQDSRTGSGCPQPLQDPILLPSSRGYILRLNISFHLDLGFICSQYK